MNKSRSNRTQEHSSKVLQWVSVGCGDAELMSSFSPQRVDRSARI